MAHLLPQEPAPIDPAGRRSRVLVCVPRYLPGYKSGGPIRAIANMVSGLSSRLDFFIVTRDRDATDTETYPGVVPGKWHRVGEAQVLYCSSVSPAILRRAVREAEPDVISLNSFQDTFTRIMMRLRRAGAFGSTPFLLAPRGEFSPGAMAIRRTKKNLYRWITRWAGFYEGLHWQVSAPSEKQHLLDAGPARRLNPDSIHVVTEIAEIPAASSPRPPKEPGSARLIFLSRISEKKNLHFLLELLPGLQGRVELNIFGPVADKDEPYWQRCKAAIERLPLDIRVEYRGSLERDGVGAALRDHHFFVLPTLGENFCHAAVESFVNGTPVLLSDQTPWVNLREARAGFDIPLEDRAAWLAALQAVIDMDQPAYNLLLEGTREYSRRFSSDAAIAEHITMFESVLPGNRQPDLAAR